MTCDPPATITRTDTPPALALSTEVVKGYLAASVADNTWRTYRA
ncbi:MAG: hypothetical protein ACYDCO_16010 [Armatimonadota bacterium]